MTQKVNFKLLHSLTSVVILYLNGITSSGKP